MKSKAMDISALKGEELFYHLTHNVNDEVSSLVALLPYAIMNKGEALLFLENMVKNGKTLWQYIPAMAMLCQRTRNWSGLSLTVHYISYNLVSFVTLLHINRWWVAKVAHHYFFQKSDFFVCYSDFITTLVFNKISVFRFNRRVLL